MATRRKAEAIRPALPLRILRAHSKLIAAAAVGGLAFLVLPVILPPDQIGGATRLLIAWDIGVALYLAMALYVILRADLSHVRQRAEIEDEGAALILLMTVLSAAAGMAAIFVELAAASNSNASGLYTAHAIVTVLLSWTFVHVIFAFHYAHEYYGEEKGERRGGLKFPDDDCPEYSDFLYFSFVIGMTFQVSDVQVTRKPVRSVVIMHGAVSFFFNVAVLALMVNIGGEFLKK